MLPRARIGLVLGAVLFASPLFLACRSTTAASNDPEIQASIGRAAAEAMAMPEKTIAEKKAKRDALDDATWAIAEPIIHRRFETHDCEFMPWGDLSSMPEDCENISMYQTTWKSGTYRVLLPRSQFPNLYLLFDAARRLDDEIAGEAVAVRGTQPEKPAAPSESPEAVAERASRRAAAPRFAELLAMPESTRTELYAKAKAISEVLPVYARPAFAVQIVADRIHPGPETESDETSRVAGCSQSIGQAHRTVGMGWGDGLTTWVNDRDLGEVSVMLQRSEYPDLYELDDCLDRLRTQISKLEHADFKEKRAEQDARSRGPVVGPATR